MLVVIGCIVTMVAATFLIFPIGIRNQDARLPVSLGLGLLTIAGKYVMLRYSGTSLSDGQAFLIVFLTLLGAIVLVFVFRRRG